MDQPVKIRAEVLAHDPSSCKFTVDRMIYKDGWARFLTADQAKSSPLAEQLFAIAGVTGVIINNDQVTVSHTPPAQWREIGPRVGTAIRAWVATGDIAVSAKAAESASSEDQLRGQIQKVIDEHINPQVASHGGVISLLDVRGSDVFIKMGGGCQGCSSADVTLRGGVEQMLRQSVPGIGRIFDTTDHAAGENPYYAAAHGH